MTSRPKLCCDLMRRGPTSTPEWQRRWHRLAYLVNSIQLHAYQAMSMMVRFRFAPRNWLTLAEHMEELETQRAEVNASSTLRVNPRTCLHPSCKRYGNLHGSFSKCKRCGQRFKWDPDLGGWLHHGEPQLQASSHLPPPSSATILDSPTDTIHSKGKGKGHRSTTSKAKAKPRARSSAASLTAGTAEHFNLDGEDYQDYPPNFWDPVAYPPDSEEGEDGYPDWDMSMDREDLL